jgi:hypothetical protein
MNTQDLIKKINETLKELGLSYTDFISIVGYEELSEDSIRESRFRLKGNHPKLLARNEALLKALGPISLKHKDQCYLNSNIDLVVLFFESHGIFLGLETDYHLYDEPNFDNSSWHEMKEKQIITKYYEKA